MNDVRSRFLAETGHLTEDNHSVSVMVTAVKLPTGAIETITNTQFLLDKIKYLRDVYDDNFCLKANPSVQIVGYLLA